MSDMIKKDIETIIVEDNNLYEFSRNLIISSRKIVYQTANFQMVETYWRIGERLLKSKAEIFMQNMARVC
jgi:hypothetical protein